MSTPIIQVQGLSKEYKIGAHKQRYDTFRDMIVRKIQASSRFFSRTNGTKNDESRIWALKDVSFEVKQGEIIGIIGRNGSGKSTLLKILSRITEPTNGKVEIHGRVASLLEVGTGFHPELTGRENVYLNGAILGMRRSEINSKFDEIVAFSEVEKFIDTPVKHYSSGMYVRLAFAVAAHLEPEILIVDEVLAVGDASFQKKCLGKMGDVAKQGRTVLFVSHNMQAIQLLCKSSIHIDMGKVVKRGDSKSVVTEYLSNLSSVENQAFWDEKSAPGNDQLKLLSIKAGLSKFFYSAICSSSKEISIEVEFMLYKKLEGLCVGFDLVRQDGVVVARSYQTDLAPESWLSIIVGKNYWSCVIPRGFLNAGIYQICPKIGIHNAYWIINMDAAIQFEVVLDHGISPYWNSLDINSRPGVIAPLLAWNVSSA